MTERYPALGVVDQGADRRGSPQRTRSASLADILDGRDGLRPRADRSVLVVGFAHKRALLRGSDTDITSRKWCSSACRPLILQIVGFTIVTWLFSSKRCFPRFRRRAARTSLASFRSSPLACCWADSFWSSSRQHAKRCRFTAPRRAALLLRTRHSPVLPYQVRRDIIRRASETGYRGRLRIVNHLILCAPRPVCI